MVEVIYIAGDDGRHELSMTGHAGYNPGNDIVCAGCSAIAYSLMGWLGDNCPGLADAADYTEADGSVEIFAVGGSEVAAVFEMAVTGLSLIAAEYPDHVSVKGNE